MSTIFLIFTIFLFIVNHRVEGIERIHAFPVNSNGCFYPCLHTEQSIIRCSDFCKSIGGWSGYCHWLNCKCEDLPTSVPHKTSVPLIGGCTHGYLPQPTTTPAP